MKRCACCESRCNSRRPVPNEKINRKKVAKINKESPVHELSDVEAGGVRLHEQHQVLCAVALAVDGTLMMTMG